MIDYEFTNAVVKKVVGSFKSNYTSLRKMLTELLQWLHVPYYDECCPDTTLLPVGYYNNVLSYYNSFEWVAINLTDINIVNIDIDNINYYIENNLFIVGQQYRLLNVHPELYGGTDVYLLAITENALSHSGVGVFYYPTYDQSLPTFGIWNNYGTWTPASVTGRFPGNATVTTNTGAVAKLVGPYTANKFTVVSGDFTDPAITSITYLTEPVISTVGPISGTTITLTTAVTSILLVGQEIVVTAGTGAFAPGTKITCILSTTQFTVSAAPTTPLVSATLKGRATATVTGITLPTVSIGDRTIWGGKYWDNLTGDMGYAEDCLNLDATNWEVVPYNDVDYIVSYDTVEVDLPNNIIVMRQDLNGNKVVTPFDDIEVFQNRNYYPIIYDHPINVMQWGNPYDTTTGKGCGNNTIYGGYAESINHIGGFADNNVESKAAIVLNATYNGHILKNVLKSSSEMKSNTIVDLATISENTISDSGSISSNILGNVSLISGNTVGYLSQINGNTSEDQGYITRNNIGIRSFITNNYFYGINSQIRYNNLYAASTITGNILNTWNLIHGNNMYNTYYTTALVTSINNNVFTTVGTANASANIVRNTMRSVSQINSNLFSANNTNIHSNDMDSVSPGQYSRINSNSLTSYGSLILGCDLRSGQILNTIITTNNLVSIELDRIVYDSLLNTVTSPVKKIKVSTSEGFYNFTKPFANSAGNGAVGAISIPYFLVPTGFFISEVFVDVGAGLTAGAGAYLTLGIATDNTTAGLDSTTGLVTTLNAAGITRITAPTTTKATANRAIEINVGGAAITAGTIGIIVKISKLV